MPNTPDSRLLRHAWVRAVELFYPPPMRRPRFHREEGTVDLTNFDSLSDDNNNGDLHVDDNNNNNIYLKSDIHIMFNRLYIKTYTNNITEIHV